MRIAICDDNKEDIIHYVDRMNTIARAHDIPVIIETFLNGKSLMFRVADSGQEEPIDILFMDVCMPVTSGLETSKRLRSNSINFCGDIIFLTHSSQHAIESFDVGAFHYIVKDVTPDDKFEQIFLSAVERAKKKSGRYLLLKGVGEYRNINIDDIHYFEVIRKLITVHYGNNQSFEFYSPMNKLELTVLPFRFLRCHRAFLAAAGQIERLTRNEIALKNGVKLPVGRTYYEDVKLALGQV